MEVTREFADRIAGAAQLLEEDEVADKTLRRLTDLAVELVPGSTAAAMTIATAQGALNFAASDRRLDELHRLQFDDGAAGPVLETLRHNEPRRIDDTSAEQRWPEFSRAARRAGFGSCLALPLRTDRHPAGAVALYAPEPDTFRGAAHDIALLFAAQGGTAVRNASLYRACRRLVDSLHAGLASKALIEQAKGILHAELGVSPAEAFRLLSRYSQDTNQRVRKISADLLQGRVTSAELATPPGRRLRPYDPSPHPNRTARRRYSAGRVTRIIPGSRVQPGMKTSSRPRSTASHIRPATRSGGTGRGRDRV
jgi:GAF domain-containing protein